jgi:hypothetical protein
MTEEHATIYWPSKPEAEYYDLSEASQKRLSEFLEVQRMVLELTGGGNKQGLSAEWEPGLAVAWDIELRPKFRKARPRWTPPFPATLGGHYRIKVLKIWKLS